MVLGSCRCQYIYIHINPHKCMCSHGFPVLKLMYAHICVYICIAYLYKRLYGNSMARMFGTMPSHTYSQMLRMVGRFSSGSSTGLAKSTRTASECLYGGVYVYMYIYALLSCSLRL